MADIINIRTDWNQGAVIAILLIAVFTIGTLYWAYGEELDLDLTNVTPECTDAITVTEHTSFGNITRTVVDCKYYAEEKQYKEIIVIVQPDCDEDCKKNLVHIKECRDSGYEGPDCGKKPTVTPTPPEKDCDEDCQKILEKAKKQYESRCLSVQDKKPDLQYFCNLYAERTVCERGYDESEPIQTHDWFLTSNWKTSIWLHWDLDTRQAEAKMEKGVQACNAQDRLHQDLGVWYKNRQEATVIDAVPNHRDRASQKIPVGHLAITPAVFNSHNNDVFEFYCNEMNWIADSTKKEQGCLFERTPLPEHFEVPVWEPLPKQKEAAYRENSCRTCEGGYTDDTFIYDEDGNWIK